MPFIAVLPNFHQICIGCQPREEVEGKEVHIYTLRAARTIYWLAVVDPVMELYVPYFLKLWGSMTVEFPPNITLKGFLVC